MAAELQGLSVQVVAVLGNHDHHSDRPAEIAAVLRDVGVAVLEGDAIRVDTPNGSIGVAGVKGFGGGFAGTNAAEFGEPEMKAFVRHSKERAEALESALGSLDTGRPDRAAALRAGPRDAAGRATRDLPVPRASCSARPWTVPGPISSSTATRTAASSTGSRRAACTCATSRRP